MKKWELYKRANKEVLVQRNISLKTAWVFFKAWLLKQNVVTEYEQIDFTSGTKEKQDVEQYY